MVTPVILCAILCNLWRVVIKLDPERFKSVQTSRDMQPFFWNVGQQLNITTWCADNDNNPTTSRYLITNCLAFRSHFPSTCTIKSWSAIAAGWRGSFLQNTNKHPAGPRRILRFRFQKAPPLAYKLPRDASACQTSASFIIL